MFKFICFNWKNLLLFLAFLKCYRIFVINIQEPKDNI